MLFMKCYSMSLIMPSPWVFLRLKVDISMPGPSLTWGRIHMSWRPPRIRTINMSWRPSWVRTWGWTLRRVEVLPAEVQVLPDGKNSIFYWSHWAGSMVSLHLIMSWKFSLMANIRPNFSDNTVTEPLIAWFYYFCVSIGIVYNIFISSIFPFLFVLA